MTPNRRQLLRTLGFATIGTIAGCSSGESQTDETTSTTAPAVAGAGEDEPTLSPTATLTKTATRTPTTTPTGPREVEASDGNGGDRFGYSVALSEDGTTALVGARYDNDPIGEDDGDTTYSGAGSAYVFSRTSSGWTQQAKLTPDDGDEGDRFGQSVALSSDGTVALVGADFDEDPNGTDRYARGGGSAYVFAESDGDWEQQAKLAADDGEGGDLFGISVALSADGATALIGAFRNGEPSAANTGAAYVFSATDGTWSQQAKLLPAEIDATLFGRSVALSADGTTALIGGPKGDNAGSVRTGVAYVFSESGGSWTQQAKLTPDDGERKDRFGGAVALSGDGSTALIGAMKHRTDDGIPTGAAYVYTSSGESWNQQTKLVPETGDHGQRFGASVALRNGSTALVGSPQDDAPGGVSAGSAYLFTREGDTWSQQRKLRTGTDAGNGRFGTAVALAATETKALVGTPNANRDYEQKVGAVYVFDA